MRRLAAARRGYGMRVHLTRPLLLLALVWGVLLGLAGPAGADSRRSSAGRPGGDGGHLPALHLPRPEEQPAHRLRRRGDEGGRQGGGLGRPVRGGAVRLALPGPGLEAHRRDRQPGDDQPRPRGALPLQHAVHLLARRDRHRQGHRRHHHARGPRRAHDRPDSEQQLGGGRARRRGGRQVRAGLRSRCGAADPGPGRRDRQRQHRRPRLPRHVGDEGREDRRRRRRRGARAGADLPPGRSRSCRSRRTLP